jgi:hypothetical protein
MARVSPSNSATRTSFPIWSFYFVSCLFGPAKLKVKSLPLEKVIET